MSQLINAAIVGLWGFAVLDCHRRHFAKKRKGVRSRRPLYPPPLPDPFAERDRDTAP